MFATIRFDVAPRAWAEAVRRAESAHSIGVRPSLHPGTRPYKTEDAARALAALIRQTPHRVIADGAKLIVEMDVGPDSLPVAILNEWNRLRAVAESGFVDEDQPAPSYVVDQETMKSDG
jgi:hypothetical protein